MKYLLIFRVATALSVNNNDDKKRRIIKASIYKCRI